MAAIVTTERQKPRSAYRYSPWEGVFVARCLTPLVTTDGGVANTFNVAVQLWSGGQPLTNYAWVDCYLTDSLTNLEITATAPSGGVAIGTNGVIIFSPVANKAFRIVTNATGAFDLTLTDTNNSGHTFYLVVTMPGGEVIISPAMTF